MDRFLAYCLFNDAASDSDYTASKCGLINPLKRSGYYIYHLL
jgi:hypothetical protein